MGEADPKASTLDASVGDVVQAMDMLSGQLC